jgi:hypothetical protein
MGREGFEISFMRWREERAASKPATATAKVTAGSCINRSGVMSVQGFATPTGSSSQPDSGVVVSGEMQLPSVSESLLEEAGSERRQDGVTEHGEEENAGEEETAGEEANAGVP